MITIFSRKELLITTSMKQQGDVREILAANGIDYKVKVTNQQNVALFGSSRARCGSLGINQDLAYVYKIYVHKSDYENALRFIK